MTLPSENRIKDNEYVTLKGRMKRYKIFFNELVINKAGIIDFDDIEGLNTLNELELLDLSNNQISKIKGLNNLESLERLEITNNNIKKIEGLENLKKLEYLDLSNNQISKIEGLNSLIELKWLILNNNQITEIQGLNILKNLREIYLNNNKITEISGFEGLNKLRVISLEKNSIPNEIKYQLGGSRRYEGMSKPQDVVKYCNLKRDKSIEQIIYQNRYFDVINDSLYLNGLNIQDITEIQSLKNLKKLKFLDLSDNQITEIKGLETLTSLETLSLSKNKIKEIGNLDNLNQLKTLYLQENNILEMKNLEHLQNLEELWLGENQISEIKGINILDKLETLNLEKNRIMEINGLENLNKLNRIHLYSNNIIPGLYQQLSPFGVHSPRGSTYVNYCKLKNEGKLSSVSFKGNKYYIYERELHLDHLNIRKIEEIQDLEKCGDIEVLNLSHNEIMKISGISTLTNLKKLNLSNNQIKKIEGLESLIYLRELDLRNNNILEIQGLQNLINLNKVYLNNNQISRGIIRELGNDGQKYVEYSKKIKHRFTINEYITLTLEKDNTVIYVDGERFDQCKFLLLEIDVDKITSLDEIQSIDEAAEKLNSSLEGVGRFRYEIPPEVEFWGHCSNLQVWAENNYNSNLLHRNLAFPLLKKLTEKYDQKAQKVFKEEIAKRIRRGHPTVFLYLLEEGYLDYLNSEELLSTFDNFDLLSQEFRKLTLNTMLNLLIESNYFWEREKYIDFLALYGNKSTLIGIINYLVSITSFLKLRDLITIAQECKDIEARSLIKPFGRLLLEADTKHEYKGTWGRNFIISDNFIYLILPYFKDLFTKIIGVDTSKSPKLQFQNISLFIEMILIINKVISSEIGFYVDNDKYFYSDSEYDGGTELREHYFEFIMKQNIIVKVDKNHISIEFSGSWTEPEILEELKKFNDSEYKFNQLN